MIEYDPAINALGFGAPLQHQLQLPLLGVPLQIRSNSASVVAAAERSFSQWHTLQPEHIADAAPLVVTVVVHPADQPTPAQPWVHRVHGAQYLAASGANIISADMASGTALAFVTPAFAADDLAFRYHVLECLGLLLTSWRDRVPVHAAAVGHAGQVLLLAGPSTAGKSTLCYACARAGFQVLAEDVVYVQQHPRLRLWGNTRRIHLLPDAPRLFPELADHPVVLQANGKRKLAIDLSAFGPDTVLRHVEAATVCLIERHGNAASSAEPAPPATIRHALAAHNEPGFDLHARADVADALAAGGGFRLLVGSDLDQAVAVVRRLLQPLHSITAML